MNLLNFTGMKNYVFILLMLFSVFFITSCSEDIMEDLENEREIADQSLIKDQSAVYNTAQNILRSYLAAPTRSNAPAFPEYYGGIYVNQDGKVVVFVKGDSIEYKSKIVHRAQSSDFIIQPCEFSYNTLTSLIDELNRFFLTDNNLLMLEELTVHSFGIQDANNKIFIALGECTPVKIAAFKDQVMDSPAFEFRQSGGLGVMHSTDLLPGDWTHSRSYQGTLGYRARANDGRVGMVTSGHLIREGEALFYELGDTQIGTCLYSTNGSTSSLDAAFIPVENTNLFNPSYRTYQRGKYLSANIAFAYPGLKIFKEGAATGPGGGSGTVIATSTSAYLYNHINSAYVFISGLVSSDYVAFNGDSGGPVYTDNSACDVVGIHEGMGDYNTTYIMPALTINNAFNLTMY